jgi:hypothetical protein
MNWRIKSFAGVGRDLAEATHSRCIRIGSIGS